MENIKKIALGVLFGALLVGGSWWFWGRSRNSMVTVTGEGKTIATPGEVSMVVTSAVVGNSAGDAISGGEAAITKLVGVAKTIMGSDIEVQRSFYQVAPRDDGKYVVANVVSLRSKNVINVSNLIKYLYTAGATTISDVNFIPKNPDQIDQQNREMAVKDAALKAEKLVASINKKLGAVVSISENDGETTSSVGDGATNISFQKKLTVVYEIK